MHGPLQEDVVHAQSTVQELLHFDCELRLGSTVSSREKTELVDDLIRVLRLTSCKDSIIGDVRTRGISGGERKRTAIAAALITNPTGLLLDEPTSGLDAQGAHDVCSILRKLADAGRTVACTIHQPSSETWSLFDSAILMMGGGTVCVDTVANVASKFDCPPRTNPADHVMHLMHKEPYRFKRTNAGFKRSSVVRGLRERSTRSLTPGGNRVSACTQVRCLALREWNTMKRNRKIIAHRLLRNTFICFFVGSIFYNVGDASRPSYRLETHYAAVVCFCMLLTVLFL